MSGPTLGARAPAAESMRPDRGLRQARALAELLDGRRIDPILGLVLPGVGDVLGALCGLFIVGVGVARHAPRRTLARMALNLALDALLGAVPLVGDLFDWHFHAHRRNVALLERPGGRGSAIVDTVVLAGAVLLLIMALCAPIVALVFAGRWLWAHR